MVRALDKADAMLTLSTTDNIRGVTEA